MYGCKAEFTINNNNHLITKTHFAGCQMLFPTSYNLSIKIFQRNLQTLWFSKQCISWWALTQLGQRNAQQSTQRATAFLCDMQPVHMTFPRRTSAASRAFSITTSSGMHDTLPPSGSAPRCWQTGHSITPLGSSFNAELTKCTMHVVQKTCKHGRTRGSVYSSLQRRHFRLSSPSNSVSLAFSSIFRAAKLPLEAVSVQASFPVASIALFYTQQWNWSYSHVKLHPFLLINQVGKSQFA